MLPLSPISSDETYDGSAKYYWDIEQVEPQSKDTWTQRQVGNWLYEYSVRQGLADSTNYLADLMNTYAFDAPDLDCTINSERCPTFDAQTFFTQGMENDVFNAGLVRAAVYNYWYWFNTMYKALDATKTDMNAIVPSVVQAFVPAYTPPVSFWDLKNPVFKDLFNLVMIFNPVEGAVTSLAESAAAKAFADANADVWKGTQYYEDLAAAIQQNTKTVTGLLKSGTNVYDKSMLVVKDAISYMSTSSGRNSDGSQSQGNSAPYLVEALSQVDDYQAQLGNALDAIFDQGFVAGGFIEQVFDGSFVVPAAKAGGDWSKNPESLSHAEALSAIGAMTVSNILKDQSVMLVKLDAAFNDLNDCVNNYVEFEFPTVVTHYCLQPPGQYSFYRYFAVTYNVGHNWFEANDACEQIKPFPGTGPLNGQTWAGFDLVETDFWFGVDSCSANNHPFANPAPAGAYYPSPDFDATNPDSLTSATQCLYNTPLCDMGSDDVISGCNTYRQQIDRYLQGVSGYDGAKWSQDTCTELEKLMYCAQYMAIEKGQATLNNFAAAYGNEFQSIFEQHLTGLDDYSETCFDIKEH
ncbi:hypothetical protein UCRPC4_g03107 [Phaeomoniella chlamydospora]|uniref:Uncharacterized protein n=1 Tax=Phaeomoniella chlamydospora TaxID=158046 RepID=A0A0G2EKU5_PHACM|nr:hypothetical protein UCRPC4_g03107 [Phaeomoniella chlamydospora]